MSSAKSISSRIRIGTRRSQLALWQAHYVRDRLSELHPALEVELVEIVSEGDKLLDVPLAKIGGKGLFLKELEAALLDGGIDIAVHSMKDVPFELPVGLELPVICERADPRDALVSSRYSSLEELPQGAVIGSCSLRRQCQLRHFRPDLKVVNLRGNVNTRLKKLDDGEFDAIVLACAGLDRLEMSDRIRQRLPETLSLPAVGQGAVGIECRADDAAVMALVAPLAHEQTARCVSAERGFNRRLEGSCQVPLAAHAHQDGSDLEIEALVGLPDGTRVLRTKARGSSEDPDAVGGQAAEELLSQGAASVLELALGWE